MIDNTRAAYRILDVNGFYSDDDTLYIVDADGNYPEIYFDGIPNEQMEPLNDLARQRLNSQLESLDKLAEADAKKLGKPFVGRPRTLDGAIAMASENERSKMSIMGNKDKSTSTERLVPSQVSETGQLNPKRGRGRPKNVIAA